MAVIKQIQAWMIDIISPWLEVLRSRFVLQYSTDITPFQQNDIDYMNERSIFRLVRRAHTGELVEIAGYILGSISAED